MIRHRLLVAFGLACAVAGLHAAQVATPAPKAAATELRRPLLWKVSDADNTVYLLGSFHLLKPGDYPLPAEIDRAFEDAESLLFEIDPAVMTAPDTPARVQAYMGYGDEPLTLSQVLPKATLERLDTLVKASGGSLATMEQSEPWAVSMGLVLGITQGMGFRADLGLDRHLMARAAEAGKPAAGLETLDEQMQAMDAVPRAEQVDSLDEFVRDPRKAVRQLDDMHAWWRTGDVDKLDRLMRVEMAEKTPASYQLLDVARNAAWMPRIEARLQAPAGQDTLVVVGSLHLLGSDGLVEQLRATGRYTVERVCDACVEAPAP
ncbi:MAG: TraB/GumN family protein [Xanthomonadales bacterium]|nr:TraB/GumN family protein [Xanthomonadales bacterium]